MLDYEYLTEHEKKLFGYIEDVPQENEPIYNMELWDEEEEEELNVLNNIFNL